MTIRLRLTLLFGLLFLAAGAGLLTINYVLVRDRLPQQVSTLTARDVINRAQKLSNVAKVPADQHVIVEEVANASTADVKKLIKNHPQVPPGLAQLLFADLPNATRADALHQLVVQSLIALAVMVAVSAGLGWYAAGRALRPLQTITHTAKRLSASTLHDRIAMRGPNDEIKQLADTFDDMLTRLDAAFASQRLFVANASHELRTPLTIMRTELDVTLRQPDATQQQLRAMGTLVRSVIDRCDRLVTSLLTLAGADEGIHSKTRVDLADLAQDALQRRATDIDRRQLTVETTLTPTPADADPALLERALDNLIDNAITHNHERGWVRVTTSTSDHNALIEVASSGPEISPDEAPTLFEPFRRAKNRTRTNKTDNAGIGLSVVRAVATAHHGNATSTPVASGGLAVTISLPAP